MNLNSAIVEWLLSRSEKHRWVSFGMERLLHANSWHCQNYEECDYDPDGDKNIRIFGIKDASVDGILSAKVKMTTDHSDEEVLLIEPYTIDDNLSHHQLRFLDLCRSSDIQPAGRDPDFGSW